MFPLRDPNETNRDTKPPTGCEGAIRPRLTLQRPTLPSRKPFWEGRRPRQAMQPLIVMRRMSFGIQWVAETVRGGRFIGNLIR
jgi:hypothetical protein